MTRLVPGTEVLFSERQIAGKIDQLGKRVLLVEDIVDTGYSIAELINMLNARGPASLAVLSLLSKPSRREVEVPIKYLGFEIPDVYVYGYGIDDGFEKNRILPYIGYKV